MIYYKKLVQLVFSLICVCFLFISTSCTVIGLVGGAVTNNFIEDSSKVSETGLSKIKTGTNFEIKRVNNKRLSGTFEGLSYIPGPFQNKNQRFQRQQKQLPQARIDR